MPKSINTNQLTQNAIYLVRGKVGFSRITRHTTDAEREAANKSRRYPINRNYSYLSLYDATVLAKDPHNPSLEEQYAGECCYRSSSPAYPGLNFNAMNKSDSLPSVAVMTGPNQYETIVPEGELEKGLDVTVVMRVFKSEGMNAGVNFESVLVNEPIRYYAGGASARTADALNDYGITFKATVPIASAEPTEPKESDQQPAEKASFASATAAPTQTQAQAPVPPVPPVQGNPFSSVAQQPMQFAPGNERLY